MTAVVRWDFSGCHDLGLHSLIKSIFAFRDLYGDQDWIYCVTHNYAKQIHLKKLRDELPWVILIDQTKKKYDLSLPPPGRSQKNPAWNLYPPVLFADRPEVHFDNDVILYRKIPEIEELLRGKIDAFISSAFRRSYSGYFLDAVVDAYNCGFFGVCGNSHFSDLIKSSLSHQKRWSHHFDAQTLVGLAMQKLSAKKIETDVVSVTGQHTHKYFGSHGSHFVGLNSGNDHAVRYFRRFLSMQNIL